MRIMGSIFCNKYFEGICLFLDLVVVVVDLVDYSVVCEHNCALRDQNSHVTCFVRTFTLLQ